MDLDELERLAQAAADATARVHAATHARERYDANEAARAAWEDLGDCGEDVLALIARVRAAEAERDRLRDRLDDVESNEITRALAEQVHGAESGER